MPHSWLPLTIWRLSLRRAHGGVTKITKLTKITKSHLVFVVFVDFVAFVPRPSARYGEEACSLACARSLIEVTQEIFECLADFGRVSVKQVIGAIDHHQLLGLWKRAVELPHVLDRADVVRFALDEELRFRTAFRVGKVV